MRSVQAHILAIEDIEAALFPASHVVTASHTLQAECVPRDHGIDAFMRADGEVVAVQAKRIEVGTRLAPSLRQRAMIVSAPAGSGKTASMLEAIQELTQVAGRLSRLIILGDPDQVSPFEPLTREFQEPSHSRVLVDLHRTLLHGVAQHGGRAVAPFSTEVEARSVVPRTLDRTVLAVHAVLLLRRCEELLNKIAQRVGAWGSACLAPASIGRLGDVHQSVESHRSRAPGNAGRPRLVCRELVAA